MGYDIKKLTNVFMGEIGYREKRSGATDLYSKTGKDVGSDNWTKYWVETYPKLQGSYWCADFVTWCFQKAFGKEAATKLLLHYPYIACQTLYDLGKKKGQIVTTPQSGDVALFYSTDKRRYAHTEFVTEGNSVSFNTVGGNTSGTDANGKVVRNGNGVFFKTYDTKTYVKAKTVFFRPNYNEQPLVSEASNNVPKGCVRGMDISSNQGKVDWSKVNNVDFVILRCAKRHGADEQFEANYAGAKNRGLKVGAYLYSYALNEDDARAEALKVLNALKGKTLDLPIFLDLEWDEQGKLGRTKVTSIAKTFMDFICQNSNFRVGIYSNQDWADALIDFHALKYPNWWAARVPKDDNGTVKLYPKTTGYKIHQYSWKGHIPGISGDIDLDYAPKTYVYGDETEGKWLEANNTYYYRLNEGGNAHGWKEIAETANPTKKHWYYFDEKGAMVRDCWLLIDGDWYAFNKDGVMRTSQWIQGKDMKWYYVSSNGKAKKHTWFEYNGKSYYFLDSTAMATDCYIKHLNMYYYVDKDGQWDGKTLYSIPQSVKVVND